MVGAALQWTVATAISLGPVGLAPTSGPTLTPDHSPPWTLEISALPAWAPDPCAGLVCRGRWTFVLATPRVDMAFVSAQVDAPRLAHGRARLSVGRTHFGGWGATVRF